MLINDRGNLIIDVIEGGGCAPDYTLSGVTFLVSGTLFEPTDFKAPVAQGGATSEARIQTWAGGASSIANTGGGGGAGYSEEPSTPIAATEVVTAAAAAAAGADGGSSSVGVLVVALGGQSPTGAQPGQGGQAAGGTGSIKFSGANGIQGAASQLGGGAAGSDGDGVSASGGPPNGGYANAPGALSGWPGGGGGSSAGAANFGRPGLVRVTFQVPSLPNAPRVIDINEYRDTADALSRVVPAPVDRVAGDLLLLLTSVQGNLVTITAPTWADGTLAQVATALLTGRAFFRTATGDANDDATVATSASERVTAHTYVIRGAGGNPEWTTASGNSNTVGTPAHTNTFGYRASLGISFAGILNNNGVTITVAPTTFEALLPTCGSANLVSSMTATCWKQFLGLGLPANTFGTTLANPWVAGTLVVPGT